MKILGWAVPLLILFSACSRSVNLRGVRVTHAPVESTVTTTTSGTVAAQQQVVLGFGTSGRVSKIWARAGDKVTTGAKIAQLDNVDLQVVYQDAAKELDRSRKLLSEGLVARAGFDDARKAAEVARANFDKTVITAPFSGIVTELNLELGEQIGVSSGKVVARLIDLKPRLVKGDVDEVDLAKLRIGQPARVRVPAVRNEPFTAVVSRVVPFVDTTKEQDRTSQIELRVTEETTVIPVGASAEVEIVIGKKLEALAVPSRVILGSGDQKYVFRAEGNRLIKTPVKTGVGNYERMEIVSGVKEGDTVAYPADDIELKDQLKAKVEAVAWP